MKICQSCRYTFTGTFWNCPRCNYSPHILEGYPAFAPELARANPGFDTGHFDQLARLAGENFWFRSRNRLILWALQKYFPQAKNIMEIGCGTGFVLAAMEETFPNLDLTGSEIFSAGLVHAAKRLKKAKLLQLDARQLPFENEFDLIGAFDVMEHIREDRLVLAQMYQALRPDGGILLTVPQHPFLWSSFDVASCHIRRYQARDLIKKVEGAGFEVVRKTSFVSLLLPLLLGSRLTKRKTASENDCMSELKIGGVANSVLEKVLDLERLLISLGVGFPCGGSLLLIARKV